MIVKQLNEGHHLLSQIEFGEQKTLIRLITYVFSQA